MQQEQWSCLSQQAWLVCVSCSTQSSPCMSYRVYSTNVLLIVTYLLASFYKMIKLLDAELVEIAVAVQHKVPDIR